MSKNTETCLFFVYRHLKRSMLLSCCGAPPPGNSYKLFQDTVWLSLRWPSPLTHACSSPCPETELGHCGGGKTVVPMVQVKKVLPSVFVRFQTWRQIKWSWSPYTESNLMQEEYKAMLNPTWLCSQYVQTRHGQWTKIYIWIIMHAFSD